MRQSRRALRQPAFLRALGLAIQSRREQLSLTIVQVASLSGTTPAALARVEAGGRNLTLLQLATIAGALEISLPELLSRAERRLHRPRRR
jgi:transcriptional regulator with XRE-family HTH domain